MASDSGSSAVAVAAAPPREGEVLVHSAATSACVYATAEQG
jgi:hypothetical protein